MTLNVQAALRKSIKAMDNWRTQTMVPHTIQPSEGEIWNTRDGKHQVVVIIKDHMRSNSDYPLIAGIVSPQDGGNFTQVQGMQYPRYTKEGWFLASGQHHPLDLVSRVV